MSLIHDILNQIELNLVENLLNSCPPKQQIRYTLRLALKYITSEMNPADKPFLISIFSITIITTSIPVFMRFNCNLVNYEILIGLNCH